MKVNPAGGLRNFTTKLLLNDIPPFAAIVDNRRSIDTLNTYVGPSIFMAYSGICKPTHPQKYRGNPSNIIYRSLWERKFMVFCDSNPSILEWGSEEIIIPYRAPDGKLRRYFPDFYIKVREKSGRITKYIIEVKPKKQTKPPNDKNKKTAAYRNAALTFAKNQSKWSAAREYCEDRQMNFLILTEDHLGV